MPKRWNLCTSGTDDNYFSHQAQVTSRPELLCQQRECLQGKVLACTCSSCFNRKSCTSITKDNKQSILFDSAASSSSKPLTRVPVIHWQWPHQILSHRSSRKYVLQRWVKLNCSCKGRYCFFTFERITVFHAGKTNQAAGCRHSHSASFPLFPPSTICQPWPVSLLLWPAHLETLSSFHSNNFDFGGSPAQVIQTQVCTNTHMHTQPVI